MESSSKQVPSGARVRQTQSLIYGLAPLLARLMIAAEFAIAAFAKASGWSGNAAYMASHGMTMIRPLLGAALVVEAVGSLSLITGYRARYAGAIMFVYLGIVTVRLHDFWNQTGTAAGGTQTHFFKNVAIMGGLLMIAVYGPGRWAIGQRDAIH